MKKIDGKKIVIMLLLPLLVPAVFIGILLFLVCYITDIFYIGISNEEESNIKQELKYYTQEEYTKEDCDTVDLSYFFEGTLDDGEEAKILIPTEERGRQFDAQYPSLEVITRCAIMKDFGEKGNAKLYEMWRNFKTPF